MTETQTTKKICPREIERRAYRDGVFHTIMFLIISATFAFEVIVLCDFI